MINIHLPNDHLKHKMDICHHIITICIMKEQNKISSLSRKILYFKKILEELNFQFNAKTIFINTKLLPIKKLKIL